ncbi:uncharacterized protein LOC122722058 [Manihot esculenta]|uniref:Uncharacterized protein n=1 Tax=Manihot esculenta TaxID=3983 RepID=A0ACB7G6K9_MANES|nr:uncharacterized protein LOC122722058 [Manihot esculenta]KAG8635877.1 hypothetical protein MANES_16G071301v8 [Manihot esculenta]
MAGSRVLSRLSTYSPSLSFKFNVSKSSLPKISPLKSGSQSQISSSAKRIYQASRLPVELSCLMSMLPLHSTTASARLTSLLPIESPSWGLVPQGKSMPL